ncbi:MAG: ATP-binding protein [Candidatus Desulfaltia sp.]|nr:ATP-binding protein [Candidatus Desulfaltia sp.]
MKFSFRGKVYTGIISIVLLSGLLMALSVRIIVAEALSTECKHRGISIALNLAARAQDPILAVDFLRMKDLIDEVSDSGDDIPYAFILDQNGQTLAHTFQEGFPVELKKANSVSKDQDYSIRLLDTGEYLIYDVAAPVFIENHRLGTVRLGLSRTRIEQTIKDLLGTIFLLTGLTILIAGLVGAGFADQVTKRVKKLRQASEKALSGDLDIQTAPLLNKNCWEIMSCNREACSAYGDRRRRCWYLAGTMCPNCIDGKYAKKIISCRTCEVYSRLSGDEIQEMAEAFDAMALTLKNNITQLKQSAETIEKSEKRYRRIFEGSIDLIFIAGNHGRFIDINRAGIEMLGYDTREDFLQSVNLADLFVETEHYENMLNEIGSKGFIKDMEYKLKTKNGCELQALFSSTAQKDETGQILRHEGIIKDITIWKDMKQQLLQADKLASLGQLSAGIAHEINNPLGLILGYTQLLMRGESKGPQVFEDLKTIEKQTCNCKIIVEALLNFARKTETQKIAININQTIKNIIAVIRHQFELDNVSLVTVLDESIQPVTGDEEKLKQVFMNLLMNARQAISESGDITIKTFAPNHNRVCVIVEDSGSGIPTNIINKIFDPFFTTKPTGLGTGLGLSVSYGIIKEHNGEISVQSEPGNGATFIVTLPVYDNTTL